MQEIKDNIKDIVVEALGFRFKPDEIKPETNMITELEIDSLVFVQMIVEVEEKFGIEFESEFLDIEKLKLYGDFENVVITYIASKITE